MIVGYARVSSTDQNLSRQLEELEKAKCEKIFSEKISGKNIDDRVEFQKMLNFVHEGDTVVVLSLDRLGRNYDDIKSTIANLGDNKVNIEVLDAPFLNFNTGNKALDKMMFDMLIGLLGYIAEQERVKIKERQRQGIEIAKREGKYIGRTVKYSKNSKDPQGRLVYQSVLENLTNGGSVRKTAKKFGVSHSTVQRIKREIKISNNLKEEK